MANELGDDSGLKGTKGEKDLFFVWTKYDTYICKKCERKQKCDPYRLKWNGM